MHRLETCLEYAINNFPTISSIRVEFRGSADWETLRQFLPIVVLQLVTGLPQLEDINLSGYSFSKSGALVSRSRIERIIGEVEDMMYKPLGEESVTITVDYNPREVKGQTKARVRRSCSGDRNQREESPLTGAWLELL